MQTLFIRYKFGFVWDKQTSDPVLTVLLSYRHRHQTEFPQLPDLFRRIELLPVVVAGLRRQFRIGELTASLL